MRRKNRRPGPSKTSPKAIASHDRQVEALELRRRGLGFREIAERLGYADPTGAHHAVMSALKETQREATEELRALEQDRLDGYLAAISEKVAAGDLLAIDRALRIQARRAKLLGLDAPVKVEAEVSTPTVAEVVDPFAQAEAMLGIESPEEPRHGGGVVVEIDDGEDAG